MLISTRAYGPVLRSQESDSGRWLANFADLASAGKASFHGFEPLASTSLDQLDRALDGAGELGGMVDCGPFPMPTGAVAYLWVEGRTGPGRTAALDTVLESPPAHELLEIVPPITKSGPAHTVADLLILSTTQARAFADEPKVQAVDRDRTIPFGYHFRSATVRQVEFIGTDVHPIADPEGLARAAAEEWLDARNVDAIVLAPTGNKAQLAGLVSAALTYGHRHAVPVFLQSSNTDTRGTRFHRVLPYLATNTPALELARAALRTMAFDTAGVLVALCHPHGRVLGADQLHALRSSLQTLNGEFFDSSPGTPATDSCCANGWSPAPERSIRSGARTSRPRSMARAARHVSEHEAGSAGNSSTSVIPSQSTTAPMACGRRWVAPPSR